MQDQELRAKLEAYRQKALADDREIAKRLDLIASSAQQVATKKLDKELRIASARHQPLTMKAAKEILHAVQIVAIDEFLRMSEKDNRLKRLCLERQELLRQITEVSKPYLFFSKVKSIAWKTGLFLVVSCAAFGLYRSQTENRVSKSNELKDQNSGIVEACSFVQDAKQPTFHEEVGCLKELEYRNRLRKDLGIF